MTMSDFYENVHALRLSALRRDHAAGYLSEEYTLAEHEAALGFLSEDDWSHEAIGVLGDWREDYCVGIGRGDVVTVYSAGRPDADSSRVIVGAYREMRGNLTREERRML